MRKLLLSTVLFLATVPAFGADLGLEPLYKAPPMGAPMWFWYSGIYGGGEINQTSFDVLGTGTGTFAVGGIRSGFLLGLERKDTIMTRIEVSAGYDFSRGSAAVMGTPLFAHIATGAVFQECADFGVPLVFLGKVTPYVGACAQQRQVAPSLDLIGSANVWANSFGGRAGVDIPTGNTTSIGINVTYLSPERAIAVGGPVVTNAKSELVEMANFKWRW